LISKAFVSIFTKERHWGVYMPFQTTL
jgi:hypothetical protein